jgi:acyl-CoA synthetase (AMP-forming)/AMP-acid ligase II
LRADAEVHRLREGNVPITGKILEVAARDPELPAIVGPGARITFGELPGDAARIWAAVTELDHSTRPVVAVSSTDAVHTARFVAGLAGYDATVATIDPRWPLPHRVRVAAGTSVTLVITDSADLAAALADADWAGRVISLDEFRALEARVEPAAAPTVRDSAEPFLMLFSSGTTSDPKAFYKTRAQYRANFAVSSAHLEPTPGTATLAPGPLSYSLTLYALIECLASGGTCHVGDRFDPLEAGRRIEAEGITRVVAVPAVIEALALAAQRAPERFAGVNLLVAGGANLPPRIRAAAARALPNARLISYYGAAEIGFIGDSRTDDGEIALYDGIDAEVRDADGVPLPDGEIGELWIRADATSDGYLPATTDERLRDARGWATVHDQARLRGRRLELLGRAGDIVVTGGHKVSLPEIERAFDAVAGLGEVCAVPVADASLGSVVALVVEGDSPAKSVLLEHARGRLAPQFVPRRFYRLPELPRTVGGKVRRGATADLLDGAVRL